MKFCHIPFKLRQRWKPSDKYKYQNGGPRLTKSIAVGYNKLQQMGKSIIILDFYLITPYYVYNNITISGYTHTTMLFVMFALQILELECSKQISVWKVPQNKGLALTCNQQLKLVIKLRLFFLELWHLVIFNKKVPQLHTIKPNRPGAFDIFNYEQHIWQWWKRVVN